MLSRSRLVRAQEWDWVTARELRQVSHVSIKYSDRIKVLQQDLKQHLRCMMEQGLGNCPHMMQAVERKFVASRHVLKAHLAIAGM